MANKEKEASKEANKTTTKVVFDDRDLKQTYANVVNATSTREEVSILFGSNQNWNNSAGELRVKLTDRIILNPYVAKRLERLLTSVVSQYEERYGTIDLGLASPQVDPSAVAE